MNEIIEVLYKNRLLSTNDEYTNFEKALSDLSDVIKEEDIPYLCKVFDDNTYDEEMMFGLIHIMELFSSERAFELTIIGIANMLENAINWAKIIIYRCLNDDFSRDMLKIAIKKANVKEKQMVVSLLNTIKCEDNDRFGAVIDTIIN